MSCSFDRCIGASLLLLVLVLGGCGGMTDDLLPSGADRRAQSTGAYMPGNPLDAATRAARLVDVDGNAFTLDDVLGSPSPPEAIVLYFTMWCPVCLAHSDHLHNTVVPTYGTARVRYFLVDYVSGDWQAMRQAARANGYLGSDLEPVLDADGTLFQRLHGAMGNVVVVDAQGTIRLNAYYQDGTALEAALAQILGS